MGISPGEGEAVADAGVEELALRAGGAHRLDYSRGYVVIAVAAPRNELDVEPSGVRIVIETADHGGWHAAKTRGCVYGS